MLQYSEFKDEIDVILQANKNDVATKSNSKLHKLNPFLDEEVVLRVGGRLGRPLMPFPVKHPIILPRHSHITDLIVKNYHEKVSHQGRGITTNELRASGYWILGCSHAVSTHIYKCITCRKMRSKAQDKKMADLPEDRLEPSPPFTYCGIDCFGPFYVKDKRTEIKKHGLIITCMASRAIHLEMLDDMSSDSFINSLHCLVALRGPVRQIRCDQVSNFVGAARTLQEVLRENKDDKLRASLTSNHCHMGGICERQIRTTRSVLNAILNQHNSRIDTALLRTFLYEAMAIVNCRPLTVEGLNEPAGPEPLTPNHLLTMKSKVVLPPPGNFVREDIYAHKRWRKVQYLANEFWSRWRKEYMLQHRQKWHKVRRNMSVDDIVILKEEDLVCGHWRLAGTGGWRELWKPCRTRTV